MIPTFVQIDAVTFINPQWIGLMFFVKAGEQWGLITSKGTYYVAKEYRASFEAAVLRKVAQ